VQWNGVAGPHSDANLNFFVGYDRRECGTERRRDDVGGPNGACQDRVKIRLQIGWRRFTAPACWRSQSQQSIIAELIVITTNAVRG